MLEIGRLILREVDQRTEHLEVGDQRIHLGHDLRVAVEIGDDSLGIAGQEAVGLAVGRAGSAVVFAGLTVIIALAAFALVNIPFLTSMGMAAAATVLSAPTGGPVTADPLPPKTEAALKSCTQRAWPYNNCVGTAVGNPKIRLVTTDKLPVE